MSREVLADQVAQRLLYGFGRVVKLFVDFGNSFVLRCSFECFAVLIVFITVFITVFILVVCIFYFGRAFVQVDAEFVKQTIGVLTGLPVELVFGDDDEMSAVRDPTGERHGATFTECATCSRDDEHIPGRRQIVEKLEPDHGFGLDALGLEKQFRCEQRVAARLLAIPRVDGLVDPFHEEVHEPRKTERNGSSRGPAPSAQRLIGISRHYRCP